MCDTTIKPIKYNDEGDVIVAGHDCEDCGNPADHYCEDPYASDMHDDWSEHFMCLACIESSWGDI